MIDWHREMDSRRALPPLLILLSSYGVDVGVHSLPFLSAFSFLSFPNLLYRVWTSFWVFTRGKWNGQRVDFGALCDVCLTWDTRREMWRRDWIGLDWTRISWMDDDRSDRLVVVMGSTGIVVSFLCLSFVLSFEDVAPPGLRMGNVDCACDALSISIFFAFFLDVDVYPSPIPFYYFLLIDIRLPSAARVQYSTLHST